MLAFITALIIKHFVADFVLQTSYQYENKGKFLHPGGLLHVLITVTATLAVFLLFNIPASHWGTILGVEFVVHYLTDFAKTRFNDKMGWTPAKDDAYFILLGFDQMIHYLTYVWIAYMLSPVLWPGLG